MSTAARAGPLLLVVISQCALASALSMSGVARPVPTVATVGSINADVYVEIPRLPAEGETLSAIGDSAILPGGKGANQAAAAARLGARSLMIGQVGATDDYGPQMLGHAQACGVDTSLVTRHPTAQTGQAFILLQPSGENSIIIIGGANQDWPVDEPLKEFACTAIREASCLLLQREIPEHVNAFAARAAAEAGVPVILDAGGVDEPLDAEILRLCTCVSPNETELSRLTRMSTDTDDEVIAAANALRKMGVSQVLVKLGARGCVLVSGGAEPTWQSAFPVASVVDTTGAGDCFTAAYAVAISEGMRPDAALRFASAAAAITIQNKGAMNSLPPREAVDDLMAEVVP